MPIRGNGETTPPLSYRTGRSFPSEDIFPFSDCPRHAKGGDEIRGSRYMTGEKYDSGALTDYFEEGDTVLFQIAAHILRHFREFRPKQQVKPQRWWPAVLNA